MAAALAAFVFFCAAASAQMPGTPPDWKPLSALAPADRALARALANDAFPPPVPGGVDWRTRARAALVPLPGGGDLLFVRLPMLGNCGSMDLRIYGPRDAEGRKGLGEFCLSGLHLAWRDGQRLPDLIEGPSDLIAVIHRATASGWGDTETIENLATASRPSAPNFARGPLAHLVRLAGGYDLPAALRDPLVRTPLRAALGPHYTTLLTNLSVRGPFDFVVGCLIARGNARHEGGVEEAILAICADGALHAGLLTGGDQFRLFSRAEDWRSLPEPVRLFFARMRAPDAPPEGVRWSRAAEWLGD